ncbi:alpha/beta fold hydrolase [Nocardia sp. SYP-A9097]|uniref:alpha/beta fold hydrolase n=1 Tax=Nocardia sp. SYP-A9097 TaxID=2663237 RepID=UPI0028161C5C|nr:alpha/beta fold hydrolase [Nocardia sp. SYP-A9097]
MLVHGGLPARRSWTRQQELEARWSLLIPSRRGFAPSPAAPRQDFLVDADDLVQCIENIDGGAHLVGFSYGGLGMCIAAGRRPSRVRSLTLIEVPLWTAARSDDSVRRLAAVADRFTAGESDAATEREFFAMAGIDRRILEAENDDLAQALELAHNLRSPWEASPRFDRIVEAAIPALIVSGNHTPAIEVLCDAVAARMGGQRVRLSGAGHAVQRVPGFNAVLEEFLTAAERSPHT